MKRLFILASAAIVALAACTKTEVVYNEAPQEIGFKAVTGSITKVAVPGEQNSSTLKGDMGVFAYLNGEDDEFFGNTQFSSETVDQLGVVWSADKYWPVTSSLDFVVYAPHQAGATYDYSNKTLEVDADNSEATTIDEQIDYLYGADFYDNSGRGFAKGTSTVPVILKHAQAKVTVSFDVANVTITDVNIDSPTLEGSYTVRYRALDGTTGNTVSVVEWEPGSPQEAVTLIETVGDVTEASLLVVPETTSTISFCYKVDGSDAEILYTIRHNDNWAHGCHYTYAVTVSPKEIYFKPSVSSDWNDAGGDDITL